MCPLPCFKGLRHGFNIAELVIVLCCLQAPRGCGRMNKVVMMNVSTGHAAIRNVPVCSGADGRTDCVLRPPVSPADCLQLSREPARIQRHLPTPRHATPHRTALPRVLGNSQPAASAVPFPCLYVNGPIPCSFLWEPTHIQTSSQSTGTALLFLGSSAIHPAD